MTHGGLRLLRDAFRKAHQPVAFLENVHAEKRRGPNIGDKKRNHFVALGQELLCFVDSNVSDVTREINNQATKSRAF